MVCSVEHRVKDGEVIGDWMPGGPGTPKTFFTARSKARVISLELATRSAARHADLRGRASTPTHADAQWDDAWRWPPA